MDPNNRKLPKSPTSSDAASPLAASAAATVAAKERALRLYPDQPSATRTGHYPNPVVDEGSGLGKGSLRRREWEETASILVDSKRFRPHRAMHYQNIS